MKQKTLGFIPTIDGKPARWDGDFQICYAGTRSFPIKLEPTRDRVRSQIQRSIRNRTREGLSVPLGKYGIERVVA